MSFEDLGLGPEILQAIADAGYTVPTPIQEKAVPYVLMGRDILGCAQTGTGKTASFTLPMIDILANGRARARMPRSLILAPTRELAAQVGENFERYGKHHKLTKALLIGGSSLGDQERLLDRGVDVLIATPGRLIDLFERGKILLADVKILVIDEADRMLDMGFMPDVERIVGLLPKIRQTLLFSATIPPEIRRLADAFLMNPKEITVDPPSSTAVTVDQKKLLTSAVPKDKRAALRTLLRAHAVQSALIFCNRKRDVGILHRSLQRHGVPAEALHGDMAQPLRMATLDRFRSGDFQILVCSDVAARGLDIPLVSHVINFDVPVNAEDYIHRIGRTGRAGRSGQAFTLVTPEDARAIRAVETLIGTTIATADVEGVSAPAEAPKPGRKRGAGRRGGGRQQQQRAANGQHEPAPDGQAETDASRKPRPAKSRKRDRKADATVPDGKAEPTKPFGEHTPAFMLRPVKIAASA